jgi:hypothetical protein
MIGPALLAVTLLTAACGKQTQPTSSDVAFDLKIFGSGWVRVEGTP